MPQRSSSQNAQTASNFSFIKDTTLRRKLVEAIETISELYIIQQDPKYAELAKEIRRVIVLYCASIIEAVFLYLYKKKNYKITKTEYKDVQTLSKRYQLDPNCKFVIASQITVPRHERELMLDVLLKLFVDKGIISEQLGKKIDKARGIRNTLHLSKSRSGMGISKSSAKESTDVVYESVIAVRNHLSGNP